MAASEHIHYADVDTDIPMVNTLSHLFGEWEGKEEMIWVEELKK